MDPYERVNFWSHSVPAVGLAILCALGFLHGSPSVTVYAACAATTHGMSALTHVFPESRTLVGRSLGHSEKQGQDKTGRHHACRPVPGHAAWVDAHQLLC